MMSPSTGITNKCKSLLFQLLIRLVSFHTLCPCNCAEGRLTNLMHADLFLDIFSTVFSLRGIDHFHCYRLLRLPVHQQPHSATMNREKRRLKKDETAWVMPPEPSDFPD